MGIIDSANIMKKKVEFLDNEKWNLIKQEREKIQDILDNIENIKESYDNNIDYIKNEKRKYDELIYEASWFDVNKIGNVLAKLVSIIEDESYEYYVAKYHGVCTYYEEGYGYDTSNINYDVYLINKESNVSYEYYEEYLSEIGSKVFRNKKDMIVLGRENLDNKKISFYDHFFNRSGLIDVKNYDYIYDFINYLIEYKIDNKKDDLNEEELSNLLNSFLNEYIKGSSKTKKGIKIKNGK